MGFSLTWEQPTIDNKAAGQSHILAKQQAFLG
jgi:hypothetical protein